MMCPYLLISINELLISIIPFIDINKYGLNVKTAAHRFLHNIHESLRRLFCTASVYGDSVCACSQNCYSVKAERIQMYGACYF